MAHKDTGMWLNAEADRHWATVSRLTQIADGPRRRRLLPGALRRWAAPAGRREERPTLEPYLALVPPSAAAAGGPGRGDRGRREKRGRAR